jgi:hypothetical protein
MRRKKSVGNAYEKKKISVGNACEKIISLGNACGVGVKKCLII